MVIWKHEPPYLSSVQTGVLSDSLGMALDS